MMIAAIAFARSYWKLIGVGLLLLALSVQTVRLGHRSNQLERAKINLNECREGRKQDRQAYKQAQQQARAENEADILRIHTEQQRITNHVEADLSARLERLRRELRAKSAAPRPAGSPQAGAVPAAPGSPDGAPRLCLKAEELLRGAEAEERYDQLISWIEQQLGVKR